MAAGLHWEWRGFGRLPRPIADRVEALPLAYPDHPEGLEFHDRYLWIPGCDINIKLREGGESGLKFKRLRERRGELELWEENPAELYELPLDGDVVQKLTAELGIRIQCPPVGPVRSQSDLLRLLESAEPRVHVVAVEKRRRAFVESTNPDHEILVEIAGITAPEPLASISLENRGSLGDAPSVNVSRAAHDALAAARDRLGLPGGLRSMSYLDALETWALGGRISSTS